MNPEQALKIIDGIEEVRGNLPEDGLLVEEALIDVKDALKKQVPKEPIWSYAYPEWFREKMKVAGKGLMADNKTYCCPICKYSLVTSAFVKAAKNKVYGDKYCKNCGQHISWENLPEEKEGYELFDIGSKGPDGMCWLHDAVDELYTKDGKRDYCYG